MGCDIHVYVELFDYHAETWIQVIAEAAAYGERNYGLFGILAGVRASDMPLIAEPRGLPRDASPGVRKEGEDADYHSHSWLTIEEILKFDWRQKTPYEEAPTCEEMASDFLKWVGFLRTGPTRLANRQPEHVRLVFWFDS